MEAKNPYIAAVLGWFLGPLGLIYVGRRRLSAALVEFIVVGIIGVITGGLGALVAGIAYAYVGWSAASESVRTAAARQQTEAQARFFAAQAGTPVGSPASGEVRCSACGASMGVDDKFCPSCGQLRQLFCPSCKTAIPPEAKFCGYCGMALTTDQKNAAGL